VGSRKWEVGSRKWKVESGKWEEKNISKSKKQKRKDIFSHSDFKAFGF